MIRALQRISRPIVRAAVHNSLWITRFRRTSFLEYRPGVSCRKSRQVSDFLYLIGNTELEQCYLCVIFIVGEDSPAWHNFSAWDGVISAQIGKKCPPGFKVSASGPKY